MILSSIRDTVGLMSPTMWLGVGFYVVLLVFLVYGFDRAVSACMPHSGSLEWIRSYDKPVFSFAGSRSHLSRKDFSFLLAGAILTGLLLAQGIWMFLRADYPALYRILRCPDTLLACSGFPLIVTACTILPAYLLLRCFVTKRFLAAVAVLGLICPMAAGVSDVSLCVPLLLLSALFLFRAADLSADAPFGKLLLPLLLSALFYAAACWCRRLCIILFPGALAFLLFLLILRAKQRTMACGKRQAVAAVGILLVWLAALLILSCSAVAYNNGYTVLTALPDPTFWFMILTQNLTLNSTTYLITIVQEALLNPLLWLGGFLAAAAALVRAVAMRRASDFVALWFFLLGLTLWCVTGLAAGPIGCWIVLIAFADLLSCRRRYRSAENRLIIADLESRIPSRSLHKPVVLYLSTTAALSLYWAAYTVYMTYLV